jgi:DNA transposition AAA+ family ATPase
MRHAVVQVKNVRNFAIQFESLESRDPGVPGIMLVHGETGAGKTTAVQWLAVQKKAVFVRALATWTPRSMLSRIAAELEGAELGSSSDMVDWIGRELTKTQRPVFIDEGDYLVGSKKLVETMRDLHDVSNVPFVVVGMSEFKKAIAKRPQLSGRVSQWIEFKTIDAEDVRAIITKLAEVTVADDLAMHMHAKTRGSFRGLIVAISRVEAFAKAKGLTSIDLAAWGKRDLTMQAA